MPLFIQTQLRNTAQYKIYSKCCRNCTFLKVVGLLVSDWTVSIRLHENAEIVICTIVSRNFLLPQTQSSRFTDMQLYEMGRARRIWYLSPMRAAKVQASLRIRAVSPEPSLLAHTSSESRGTFRQEARSLAPLNGWACAVKICHDGMLEDTNSLGGAQMSVFRLVGPDYDRTNSNAKSLIQCHVTICFLFVSLACCKG